MIGRCFIAAFGCALLVGILPSLVTAADGARRYAASDSHSGYVHRIDLYDASNTKINTSAENPTPYSPQQTCGRCHDFATISHGWHFSAIDGDALPGRGGQPWIWNDSRTGTHLPLSYRNWQGTFAPDKVGISRWQMAAKFGGYLPGGGPGSKESLAANASASDRTKITGELLVDCMICHHNAGSGYSPFLWTEQIEIENFPYAPAVAMGLGTVDGNLKRLKDDFDPQASGAAEKMPKFAYEPDRIGDDGKVFFDLVRKPKNDACYYCHTNVDADAVAGNRWLHDDDIHIRAGIACADCHRNGLDHQTVRGFQGEVHESGANIASLSCQGCHLGETPTAPVAAEMAGRLGAPRPTHRGIPPLHFDKLNCTACHSGPLPQSSPPRLVNAIVHRLGEHQRRTGLELPAIVSPVMLPLNAQSSESPIAKYTPHRLYWPSYWATINGDDITPLHPDESFELLRKALKVRGDFTSELAEVKLPLSKRSELLGPERVKVKPEELTEAESTKLATAEAELRTAQVQSRLAEALAAIAIKYPESTPVFISGGSAFIRSAEAGIKELDSTAIQVAADFVAWPLAHNVRPATQSWGASGCAECHRTDSPFFGANVLPVGLIPNQTLAAFPIHQRQQVDMVRIGQWNQMFAGRSTFKYASFAAMGITIMIALSAWLSGRPSLIDFTIGWGRFIKRAGYLGFMLCVLALGVTSFGSLWFNGHVLGYPLLVHLMAAGAFVFLLLLLATSHLPSNNISKLNRSTWISRASLWGLVIASIVTAGTMLTSMLPLFDTAGLLQAAWLHRYAAVVVIVLAIVHSLGQLRPSSR